MSLTAKTPLISPRFMDSVVAIGRKDPKTKEIFWIATGFLYAELDTHNKTDEDRFIVGLVTNRHVFEGLDEVCLRFNPRLPSDPARKYKLDLVDSADNPKWTAHPNKEIDIAIAPINIQRLIDDKIKVAFFRGNKDSAPIDRLKEHGVTEGDGAYVLGFPMGDVGDTRNLVIVRGGTIARIRDVLSKNNHTFLLDAFIFPGNSGGPVIFKPEIFYMDDSPTLYPTLIGIVRAYTSYRNVAVSTRTGQTRVIFEENSGLASVHPVDYIHETFLESVKKFGVTR